MTIVFYTNKIYIITITVVIAILREKAVKQNSLNLLLTVNKFKLLKLGAHREIAVEHLIL